MSRNFEYTSFYFKDNFLGFYAIMLNNLKNWWIYTRSLNFQLSVSILELDNNNIYDLDSLHPRIPRYIILVLNSKSL